MMQRAHQTSRSDLRHDVAHAIVRCNRRRRIVQCQQNPSDCLHQEREQRHAPKHLMPTGRSRNLFVKKVLNRTFDSGAVFEPTQQPTKHARLGLLNFGADQELAVFDLYWIAVQRTCCGSAQYLPVNREPRAMAGANELVAGLLPVIRAAQMRTLR